MTARKTPAKPAVRTFTEKEIITAATETLNARDIESLLEELDIRIERKVKITAVITLSPTGFVADNDEIVDQAETILGGGHCYDWENWVDQIDSVTIDDA